MYHRMGNNAPQEPRRNPIEHFAYELLRSAKLDALPEEVRVEMTARIQDQAQQRIGMIAVQLLDDRGLEDFNTLMSAETLPDPEVVQQFFVERIEGFEQKVQDGLMAFADEFLRAAQQQHVAMPQTQ